MLKETNQIKSLSFILHNDIPYSCPLSHLLFLLLTFIYKKNVNEQQEKNSLCYFRHWWYNKAYMSARLIASLLILTVGMMKSTHLQDLWTNVMSSSVGIMHAIILNPSSLYTKALHTASSYMWKLNLFVYTWNKTTNAHYK